MTWMRYEWPEIRPTSNRSSELYFSPTVHVLAGIGSACEVRFRLLAAGSAVAGVPTWLASSVALFHEPKMATGSYGVPPDCMSPAVQLGSIEMSVMNTTGR